MANSYMFDDIPLYLAAYFSVQHSTLERSIILKYICKVKWNERNINVVVILKS